MEPVAGPDDNQRIPRSSSWAVRGLTYHDGYLWSIDAAACTLNKIDPADGSVEGTYELPDGDPRGLTWLNGKFWMVNAADGSICSFAVDSGMTIDGAFSDWDGIDPLGWDPEGDLSAGDTVDWVTLWAVHTNDALFLSYETQVISILPECLAVCRSVGWR
jgi:hypothetical protein